MNQSLNATISLRFSYHTLLYNAVASMVACLICDHFPSADLSHGQNSNNCFTTRKSDTYHDHTNCKICYTHFKSCQVYQLTTN